MIYGQLNIIKIFTILSNELINEILHIILTKLHLQ